MKYIIILIIGIINITAQTQSINFRKGPHLIYSGSTSEMKVLWQLNISLQCKLKWGLDAENYTDSITTIESGNGVDEHQHSFVISNLISNQRYYYQIILGNDTVSSSFLSAQEESIPETVFFAYGDTRSYPESQDLVSSAILSEISSLPSSQTFLLHAGDWTNNDSEEAWDLEFFNRNYESNIDLQSSIPIMGCKGNHEQSGIQYNKYWPYNYQNSGDFYSFDYGIAHIAVIDLYTDFSTDSEQLLWLQNDLETSNNIWNFILLHEPAYTDTSAHKNNIDVQNYIVPICIDNNVKLIFGGHNHYYAHCYIDNIHHLTLGGGGAPLYGVNQTGEGLVLSESSLHFSKITLSDSQAIIEIIRPDNSIIETFTLDALTEIKPIQKITPIKIKQIEDNLYVSQEYDDALQIHIYNTLGQTLISERLMDKTKLINLSSLKKGIYLISVKSRTYSTIKKILID